MWTGRWTTSSPNIKEEKSVSHPVTDLPPAQPGHPAPHSASPNNTQPPANLGSPYPASFPDTIVFTQPTTTSSDILYESINMSQAYPTLTSSLGESQSQSDSSVQSSHEGCIFEKISHHQAAPPQRAVFPW